MNQLQAIAINEGIRYKKRLWRDTGRKQLETLSLAPWASRRREDLLQVLDRINPTIAELTQAIENEAVKCPQARRLMTHPGVGALTAVAFVLIIGEAHRFDRGRQIAAYLGLVPEEDSSGERRRLGHISTGQLLIAFLAGGSGAGYSTQRSQMAQPIFPLGKATRTKDRESSHGTEAGRSFVLDVAQRMELRATGKVRFARGTAWNRPWCAVNHRRND